MVAATGTYLDALGLSRSPFPTTPDAACYFCTPWLREEQAETLHCLLARKGFVLITGEVGLGKSTFVRRLADDVQQQGCAVAFVLNTFLHGGDLLRSINGDLGIEPGLDFADDLTRLNTFLLHQHGADRTVLLVIDDAQNLSLENLELIRMLSNLETSQDKLLQILLCGQPELVDKLAQPSIRQLASRIVKHVQLRRLEPAETRAYVDFRLSRAGADIAMGPRALRALQQRSRGNPRRMHMILDQCLYGLVAGRVRTITATLVQRGAAEAGMRLGPRRSRRGRQRLALGAIALLGLAGVVAAAVLEPRPAAVAASHAALTPAAPELGGAVVAPLEPPPTIATWSTVAKMSSSPPSLNACLAHFGLRDPDRSIHAALDSGDMAALRTAVAGQHPALVVLEVPENLDSGQLPAGACLLREHGPRIALWRATPGLSAFRFGGHGAEIRQLQLLLSRGGHYLYRLDGIAGPRTVAAVADFQRDHQLVATGFPDALTLFILAREAADSAPPTPPSET